MSEIIASRGFTNDNNDQLSFFIEDTGIDILLLIEHCTSARRDKSIKIKISREVLDMYLCLWFICLIILNIFNMLRCIFIKNSFIFYR